MKPTALSSLAIFLTLAAATLLLAHVPLGASEMDTRIEESAKKSYVYRTYLMDDAIQTHSKDGVVTLTGSVNDDSHKLLASDTVSGLLGVKSVINEIEVKASPPKDSDTWLYLKVKSTLAYHSSVSALNTQVEMKQGVAILKGEAISEAQKELTTEYVKDIEGITEVKNEMLVVTPSKQPERSIGEMIDDASISAQVRMALMSHRSTSAFRTSVATLEAVVTVGGSAKSAAEKDLVTRLVTDIKGVKSVVNNMIVEAAATTN